MTVMLYIRKILRPSWFVDLKDRLETDGWTDTADRITLLANAVGNRERKCAENYSK